MQTEAFRFGNGVVDDWEGRVNSWPINEGLIDYVDPSYGEPTDENPLYRPNVIANRQLQIGPETVDASTITKELLAGKLQEAGDVENERGHRLPRHRVPALGPGPATAPAQAPATALDRLCAGDACTHGNCDRRRDYLAAASGLLVDDLAEMAADWQPGGAARAGLAAGDEATGLGNILTGIASLSYGELAGERMKRGLLLHDPKAEHDRFSDNTHNALYYDQVGMMAVGLPATRAWTGRSPRGRAWPDRRRPGTRSQGSGRRPDG